MEEKYASDLIRLFIKSSGKEKLFLERKAIALWPQLMGEYIANNTGKVNVSQGVMYVKVFNAALRFELNNSRSMIIQKINNQLGQEVILNMVFS